jgi:hypothetical protein
VVEVPIQKWGVADFFAKVSLTVAGDMSRLTTTQAVDLCMKAGSTEICGADIPKCDGDYTHGMSTLLGAAQRTICQGSSDYDWHEVFGAPPITMFPKQVMEFTDACVVAASPPPPTAVAPPPPPTVTLIMQASGSVDDYADASALKDKVASAAGVGASDVEIRVTAASVIITAVINVPSTTTVAAVSDSLSTKLNSADAASKELGITVEAIPTVLVVYAPASGSSSSSTNAGAVAGAVISVLLFLGTIATIVYLVKKERIANPLDRLKAKLGKRKEGGIANPLDRLKEKLGKRKEGGKMRAERETAEPAAKVESEAAKVESEAAKAARVRV